jgi:uncharacterized alkaline shock family protein YloU
MQEEQLNKGLTTEDASEIVSSGTVRIASDVVATIAGLAATSVDGIAGMSGGIAGGITEMLGRKNFTKGVKVDVNGMEATIDLFIIIKYGSAIPKVAENAQNAVRSAVETMTGLKCPAVNIHVQGVTFPQGHPAEEKAEE